MKTLSRDTIMSPLWVIGFLSIYSDRLSLLKIQRQQRYQSVILPAGFDAHTNTTGQHMEVLQGEEPGKCLSLTNHTNPGKLPHIQPPKNENLRLEQRM